MIGQRVESQRGLPWGSLLLLFIGVDLVVGGSVLRASGLALTGVLPLALGLSFGLLGRERPFVATFTEEAIEAEEPSSTIPYAQIQNVWAGGQPQDPVTFRDKSRTIQVQHEGGLLRIPARLNVPSHEVYRFLVGQIPLCGSRDINPALAEYLERQESYFGADGVWTFRATRARVRGGRYRQLRAFCLGLILAGIAWMVLGFSGLSETGWGVAGLVCSIFGALFYAASFAEGVPAGQSIKNWKKASIVIGPQGMAMVQGDVEGEVRWPELIDVRYRPRPQSFTFTQAGLIRGILLKVKGADIVIADIYDRPLYLIYNRILACSGRADPVEQELL
jgi:hypothetical protein